MTGGKTESPKVGAITNFAQHGHTGARVSEIIPQNAGNAE
jgi:hypothetical protein